MLVLIFGGTGLLAAWLGLVRRRSWALLLGFGVLALYTLLTGGLFALIAPAGLYYLALWALALAGAWLAWPRPAAVTPPPSGPTP